MTYYTSENEIRTLPSIDWLFISWAIGVSLFAVFFIFNYWKSYQKISCAIPIENNVLGKWKSEHQLRRSIQILTSDQITTPLTVGILKPKIIIPAKTDFSQELNLQYMLEHEFYHIKRWDVFWKILTIAIACFHWFNPFVWVMCVLANRDLEISCDGWVMRKFGNNERKKYAYMLIEMAEQRGEFAPFYSAFAKHVVEERIESIMKTKKTTWICVSVATLLIGLLTLNAFATSADYEEEVNGWDADYEEQVSDWDADYEEINDWDIVTPLDSTYWLNYTGIPDDEEYSVGELFIPAINTRLPIFQGVNEPNITIGAGSMKPDFIMGEGNITLASHWDPNPRVRFGGLHLVEEGDLLLLSDAEYLYIYETIIYNTIITRYQVEITDYVEGKTYLTLFTCTPDGTERLMVRGEFVESIPIAELRSSLD